MGRGDGPGKRSSPCYIPEKSINAAVRLQEKELSHKSNCLVRQLLIFSVFRLSFSRFALKTTAFYGKESSCYCCLRQSGISHSAECDQGRAASPKAGETFFTVLQERYILQRHPARHMFPQHIPCRRHTRIRQAERFLRL